MMMSNNTATHLDW